MPEAREMPEPSAKVGQIEMAMHQAKRVSSFNDSLFCQRLRKLSQKADTSLKNLCTATENLVEHAKAISDQIIRHLPQFTLHDHTHLWNVLGFMEELAGGKKGIAKLGAGDCAMAVWAAFIHDLGMVLDASELAALDAADGYDTSTGDANAPKTLSESRVQEWRSCRDGHESWNSIRKSPKASVSRMKLGIIRAAFIRDSHAMQSTQTGHCRIADWVAKIAQTDRLVAKALADFTLENRLVCVAVSHNQDIAWLPRQLAALGVGTPDAEHCGAALGHIHWTWIGWLLRLADIFDCDSSRTPRILFDHAGITDPRSQTEWKKHLSIREPPVWEAGADGKTLLYTCQLSPAPVVEKATLQIIGWMNDELKNCRAAWNSVPTERRNGMTFAIPSEAKLEIKARADDYLYQDIEFRLERDAVVELLMGESLYGGPELALRELVQNALDAVHLRDQRNKLAEAIELSNSTDKPRFPSEPWQAVEGKVEVTWGTAADGRSWVRVSDNGVGMTIDTMRRFLTQVGKSYYKSDDFRAEQNLMRRHDILCTAISQFGIGFLSVFMLADHVEILTRPIGATGTPDRTRSDWQETQRFPFRADIHGPHGLLAFYPDQTIRRPGTTVTVWLKPGFKLPDWDRDFVIARLKQEFYETDLSDSDQERLKVIKNTPSAGPQLLDPAFEISRFIVWPLYPVHLGPSPGSIVLDDCFHFQELVPLDAEALRGKAEEWGEEIPEAVRCGWQRCEWTDRQTGLRGAEGTGTRIRLVTPQPDGQLANVMTLNQWGQLPDALPLGKSRSCLATFAEPQLPAPQWRYQCLVNGVRIVPGFVPANSERDCLLPMILQQMTLVPGPGGWVWIDLRGEAMPRLRADRSLPVRTQSETWKLQSLMQRWLESVPARPPVWLVSTIQSPEIRNRLQTQRRHRIGLPGMGPLAVLADLIGESAVRRALNSALPWDQGRLFALDRARALDLDRSRALDRGREQELVLDLDLDLAHDRALAHDLAHAHDLDNDLARAVALARALAHAHALDLRRALARDPDRDLFSSLARARGQAQAFLNLIQLHLLSEAFWPNLQQSLPALGWCGLPGSIDEYGLTGPLHAELAAQTQLPQWLGEYDLVAPVTAFALPRLRQLFPQWMQERAHRAIFLLPLLLGEEPEGWRSRLKSNRPFNRLMLFMPNPAHYEWTFSKHSEDEWAQGSISALWNLQTGKVVYAEGIHTEASLQDRGQPLRQRLKDRRR